MFEDITFRNNEHRRATRTSHRLINKYQELKKFTEIYKSSSKIKAKTKRKSQHRPSQKKKILQLIHQEFDKRSLLKPEETYEIWHELSDSINKNVAKNNSKKKSDRKHKKGSKGNDIIEGNNEEEEQEEDEKEDEELDEDENLMTHKLNQFVNNFDTSNRLSKFKFIIESNGLEILPRINEEDNTTTNNNNNNNDTDQLK
ncbi:hypothetical protein FOB64_004205 [Candida albicans]|uniref:Uncharacterized protein n=1 Tax=Candida albicans TaxID=5476 RepID=A0A8H6BYP9_CANAX|nr:hypothetical protein FOB64_004205 [Candida albicans]